MDSSKKNNEGEMGSGDSDDEFYNVKLPTAPDVTSNKPYKKPEVKKVYSPPRTKVQYDYKFDSSSDEEADGKNSSREMKPTTETGEKNKSEKQQKKNDESVSEGTNLPENTFKEFEKICEQIKNVNQGTQEKSEASESHAPASVQPGMSIPRTTKGVIPPVVVVPPPLVVPQASIMGPMLVPSMGMRAPVMLPSQNLMMNPNAMTLAGNAMMGMPGMMGMQGNIMGMPGGMIMPAMGGLNMGLPGNMLRMPANPLLRMQGPTNSVMGISSPASTLRPANVPPPPANLIVNNQVMANPSLMVMGGMINNPITSTNQSTQANFLSNSMVRLVNTPQGSLPVRVPPPPPFLNFRGRPPVPPGNYRWTANSKLQSNVGKTGSPTDSSPGATSPESSPLDKSGDLDGEEIFTDEKDKSSPHDTDESESPPRELPNTFKNDGSFMEMFKKMREESENSQETSNNEKASGDPEGNESSSGVKKPSVMISGIVGKRRGGRVLKTGLVKKVKKGGDAEEEEHPKDAWSMYMAEVKKYREASCEEEGKTRPLVK